MDSSTLQSSSIPKPPSNLPKPPPSNLQIPISNGSQIGTQMPQLSPPNLSPEMSKRPGMPPSHPNNHPSRPAFQQPGSSHHRSLSQSPIFPLDSLPPLSPLTYRDSLVLSSSLSDSVEERVVKSHNRSIPLTVNRGVGESLPLPVNRGVGESLPRRRGHSRSSSDNIPLGFNMMIQSSPQLIPIGSGGVLDRSVSGRENSGVEKPMQLGKREAGWNSNAEGMGDGKSEGEITDDDLFSAYMNLDNFDTLNSSGSTKTNGGESSDNEVESHVNRNYIGLQQGTSSIVSAEKRVKRSASGDTAPTVRHHRSVSMDSYIGDLHFGDIPPPPPGTQVGPYDFLSAEFCEADMKKIMENEKLTEFAVSNPKLVKRILANRKSAARSKEKKTQYIVELENKVQILQTETTTLSAQVTMFQRNSFGLKSENNELKFRIQAMEQQDQLKDALMNKLAEEVQRLKHEHERLKLEHDREVHLSNCIAQQLSINPQMFRLQHQQPNQLNVYPLQHQQPQQQEQQPQHNQLQPQ